MLRDHLKLIIVVTLLALPVAGSAHGDDSPRFFIESISVRGARPAAGHIILAESRLHDGHEYTEDDLRVAVGRIHRLAFVIRAELRLEKGTLPDRHHLSIEITEAKPLFIDLSSTTTWTSHPTAVYAGPDQPPDFRRRIDDIRFDGATIGVRRFLGSKGVAFAAAQSSGPLTSISRTVKYSAGYTHYDLLGSGVSMTAIVTARTGLLNSTFFEYELIAAMPIGKTQTFRVSWQEKRDGLDVENLPQRSLRGYAGEMTWSHDTTDDPFFPARGTAVAITSIASRRVYADTVISDAAGNVTYLELGALRALHSTIQARRYWELTQRQSFSAGAEGQRYERSSPSLVAGRYLAFGGYSFDLTRGNRRLGQGDARIEGELSRSRSIGPAYPRDELKARVGLRFRNSWGSLRADLQFRLQEYQGHGID